MGWALVFSEQLPTILQHRIVSHTPLASKQTIRYFEWMESLNIVKLVAVSCKFLARPARHRKMLLGIGAIESSDMNFNPGDHLSVKEAPKIAGKSRTTIWPTKGHRMLASLNTSYNDTSCHQFLEIL